MMPGAEGQTVFVLMFDDTLIGVFSSSDTALDAGRRAGAVWEWVPGLRQYEARVPGVGHCRVLEERVR